MKKKKLTKYEKPKIKSSKIKAISLYGRGIMGSASGTEYLAIITT